MVSPTNDAGAGIVNRLANAERLDYKYTSSSGIRAIKFGEKLRVADDWDFDGDGEADEDTAGKVFRFMGVDRAEHEDCDGANPPATCPLDLAEQDYTDFALWKEVTEQSVLTDSVVYALLSSVGQSLVGDAKSFYGLIDRNDVRGVVEAFIEDMTVAAGGDITVSALQDARLYASDESVISTWSGYGGMIVTNLVLSAADAYISGSDVTTTGGGNLTVQADNISVLDSVATSKIEAWEAISGVAVFNSIGHQPSNIFFNALEALIGRAESDANYSTTDRPEEIRTGDRVRVGSKSYWYEGGTITDLSGNGLDLSDNLRNYATSDDWTEVTPVFGFEQPARARAWIIDTPLTIVGGLTVSATSAAQLTALAGNENVAEAQLDIAFSAKWQAKGVAGGGIIASNKVSSEASAFIDFTTGLGKVTVGGDLLVAAADSAGIDSTSTVVQLALTGEYARRRDRPGGEPGGDHERQHHPRRLRLLHQVRHPDPRGGRPGAARRRRRAAAATPARSTVQGRRHPARRPLAPRTTRSRAGGSSSWPTRATSTTSSAARATST